MALRFVRRIFFVFVLVSGLLASVAVGSQSRGISFRMIAVPTEQDATLLLEQIEGGIPFDELAREFSIDAATRDAGGFLGPIPAESMRPEYRNALRGLGPGETSPPVPLDSAFSLFHLVDPQEELWMQQRTAGLDAFVRGDYAEAEELLRSTVEAAEPWGAEDLRLAQSLTALAGFYQSQNRYRESLTLLERVLETQTVAVGDAHPFVGETLNNLAEIYHLQQQFGQAETFYLRSLAVLELSLGREHPDVGVILNNLGMLYQEQNQHARAQPLFLQSLQIMEQIVGPDDPTLAMTIANLARAYHAQTNYTQAARMYRRTLSLLEPVLGTSDPSVREIRRYLTAASGRLPLPDQTDLLGNLPQ